MLIYYTTVAEEMVVTDDIEDVYRACFVHSTDALGTIWQGGKRVGEFTIKVFK